MGGPAQKITKRTVDNLKPGQTAWDGEMRGFGVRCQRRDKVYVLKYRYRGRQRWVSIGRHGSPWTPNSARNEALRSLIAAFPTRAMFFCLTGLMVLSGVGTA